MGHSIIPPRSDLQFAVVDGMTGDVRSWHRSEEAAEAAILAESRAFRRRYPADGSRGNATAYLPRNVLQVPPEGRYVERSGAHSTVWA